MKICCLFIPTTILVLAGTVRAASSQEMSTGQPVTIGIEEQDYFPHYGFEHIETGTPTKVGIIFDILDEISRHSGITFKVKPLPVERLHREIISPDRHTVDLKYPSSPFWRKELKGKANILYSSPVLRYVDSVIVLVTPDHDPRKKRLNRVATVLGFTPWAIREDISKGQVTITRVKSIEQGLRQLFHNRIPGFYANLHVARSVADRLKLTPRLKNNSKTFSLQASEAMNQDPGFYHFSSSKRPDIIQKMNQFLKKHQALIRSLEKKYKLDL